jgi:hypothetical protein
MEVTHFEVLGIPDGTKIDLKTLGCKGVDWIHPTKVRVEFRSLMKMLNLRVP